MEEEKERGRVRGGWLDNEREKDCVHMSVCERERERKREKEKEMEREWGKKERDMMGK